MDVQNAPGSHPDPWLDLLGGYVTATVEALNAGGLHVQRSWLDPSDPRDATIVLADTRALVFDEVSGWRYGTFTDGRQALRTKLDNAAQIGGGVLLNGRELVHRLVNGKFADHHEYRSCTDLHDGFDDALRAYGKLR